MKQRRGREVQAPRDRRGAPGRQISSVAREPCFSQLPFKLIVATAWLAYSNVDLFIRGHKKRQEP